MLAVGMLEDGLYNTLLCIISWKHYSVFCKFCFILEGLLGHVMIYRLLSFHYIVYVNVFFSRFSFLLKTISLNLSSYSCDAWFMLGDRALVSKNVFPVHWLSLCTLACKTLDESLFTLWSMNFGDIWLCSFFLSRIAWSYVIYSQLCYTIACLLWLFYKKSVSVINLSLFDILLTMINA